ncbi:MAG: hypothetical protein JO072_16125, partial [Parafilimonas sp.]|nr:hypothetical protein [Parafilimonas sp.]
LNFYGTQALLTNFATPALIASKNIDEENSYIEEWINFINVKNNAYVSKLADFIQPANDNFERRNRFLDHLLARFSENFTDYAAMMYKFTGDVLESKHKKTAQEIADDKFKFLAEYDVLSYNRGKGQFCKCCDEVNCDAPLPKPQTLSIDETLEYDAQSIPVAANATGLQKRTSAMLGMNTSNSSNLALNKFFVQPNGSNFQFILQYNATHQLISTGTYSSEKEAFAAMENIVPLIIDENDENNSNIYFKVKAVSGGFHVEIKQDPNAAAIFATSTPVYTTKPAAQKAIELIKQAFLDEGMHVIEHILLRPLPFANKIQSPELDNFFPLCAALNTACDCPETDYYSFRISVILPYWTDRFRNIDFRNFAESTIHREVPVHILPKFCWVSMYDMNRFEDAYTEWFRENKKYKPDIQKLNQLLNNLIITINTLSNVYPEGHLHDCDNPSTDNPVILNQTILGTF